MTQKQIDYIVDWQRGELEHKDTGLERTVLPTLLFYQSHALIVSGIRRCGKSTLLLQLLQRQGENYFYLSFDDPKLTGLEIADYMLLDQSIKKSGVRILFFD
jgi:predicted AAA+ superfamily ATPase